MDQLQLFVVVSTKKFPDGTRVAGKAQSKSDTLGSLRFVSQCKCYNKYGPFSILPVEEAERQKLYGKIKVPTIIVSTRLVMRIPSPQ